MISDSIALFVELGLYKNYLEALGKITALLLENTSDQNESEVLSLLVETTGASYGCLFINSTLNDGSVIARLQPTWAKSRRSSFLPSLTLFQQIDYSQYPLLSDKLHVGMVFESQLEDLPTPERNLFKSQDIRSVLCIPLLMGGELEGFIGLFCQHKPRSWLSMEVDMLCTIANLLALSIARKRVEQELQASEERLRSLVGATEDIVIEYDTRGIILNAWLNKQSLLLQSTEDMVGKHLVTALPNDMAAAFMEAMPSVLKSGVAKDIEYALTFLEDDRFYIGRLQAVPAESSPGHTVVALVRDVTSLMQEEAKHKAMLNTLDLLEEAIVDLTPEGELAESTATWRKLRGESSSAHDQDCNFINCVHRDDRDVVVAALASLANGEKPSAVVRFRLNRQEQEPIWVEGRLLAIVSAQGHIVRIRGILRDITSTYLQERRITQMALHDALTQLPNRVLLEEHLFQAIARAQRNHTKVALGFIDLDHFKQINDTLGHKAGDTVLLTLSQRLKNVLREVDTLSRWGGDEFVVLLPEVSNETDFRPVAERLREAARQTIEIDGIETKLTISIGFAVYPDDAESAETLMSVADHTMFHAKNMGRNNVQFFSDIHDKALDRENVMLQTRFSQAVQEAILQVFYQPVVDASTGRIISVEALARWHDDQNGWVSPEIFVPMAEHLGMIHELGEQVFEHSMGRLKAWRQTGYGPTLAVNISRSQLFAPDFTVKLMSRLEKFELAPSDVVLEITESVALLDISYESKRLNELARIGFRLAIDDFGTGYSGLAQLHEMPVHILKVDASFTSRLDSHSGQRIVQAIVQMAEALGLETIVEGVEHAETADYLRSIGVKQMQGFYFSEPVPAGVCESLMKKRVYPKS